MILNNFKKVLFLASRGSSSTRQNPVSPISTTGSTSGYSLTQVQTAICSRMKYLPSDISDDGDFCVAIGTDDTPVTIDDYKWEHGIDSLTDSGYSHKIINRNGDWVCRYIRTFANDTSEDITVKEVALIQFAVGIKVMIAREVLDQPLTIKPGEVQALGIDIGNDNEHKEQ